MLKKLLLSIVLTALVGVVAAQTLQFEFEGHVYANNEIVICDVTPNEIGEMVLEMQIRNLTGRTLPVIVEKEPLKVVEGTANSFCWGMCFGPDVMVSPDPVDVEGLGVSGDHMLSFHYQVDPTFSGDLNECLPGTTVVKYYAYQEGNPSTKICLEVWFAYNANDVAEHTFSFGQAYPNPATSTVHFDLQSESDASIDAVVYNLLGQEVKSQLVSGRQNRVTIAVDDLQPGIYFCRFSVNGEMVKTEKFIVKR